MQLALPGEWEPSKVVIPKTDGSDDITSRELIAVGPGFPGAGASGLDAVSVIEGYAASRGLPNVLDPNAPDDAASVSGNFPQNWMSAMFNDGTDQTAAVVDDMITENNIAPYPFENDGVNIDTMYPGGANQLLGAQIHDITPLYSTSATTNVGHARIKGGNFPCGLICVNWAPETTANVVIQVDLIPGDHRGYLAESMQDICWSLS
jgi:hypothetical protein